jgi:hypothetical protein
MSIDVAIVLLQNSPVWSDEGTQFPYYEHISLNVEIVLLQNPSVCLLLTFMKKIDQYNRKIGVRIGGSDSQNFARLYS